MTRWRQPLVKFGVALGLAVTLAVSSGPLPADNPGNLPHVVRVEEDWSLSVNQPDANLAAPQVSTQMARYPWAPRFCNLHLNSTDLPSFATGGLQLQAWHNNDNIAVLTASNPAVMATSNELVTWTQYLRVGNGQLYFGVGTTQPGVAGSSSTTWGDFSGIEVNVPGASANLDAYDPSYSVNNSGVTFGANRVDSFTLVQVRYSYSDGSTYTDSTPRVVYSSQVNGLGGDN